MNSGARLSPLVKPFFFYRYAGLGRRMTSKCRPLRVRDSERAFLNFRSDHVMMPRTRHNYPKASTTHNPFVVVRAYYS